MASTTSLPPLEATPLRSEPACRRKPVVLTLITSLWPGNDASGWNISIAALAEALQDEFEFLAVSRDRPFGAPAPSASSGEWFAWRSGRVRYCAPGALGVKGLAKILREIPYDLLLLNGFHDRHFTIPALLLRRFGLAPRRATILSPRGEFSAGALGLKAGRKAAYQTTARRLGLLSDVWLHATSEDEAAEFERGFPYARRIAVAPDFGMPLEPLAHRSAPPGPLRIVFLGRVSRVKNLDLALRALAHVTAPVAFDIYGPLQDAAYWAECERLIARKEIKNASDRDMFETAHRRIELAGLVCAYRDRKRELSSIDSGGTINKPAQADDTSRSRFLSWARQSSSLPPISCSCQAAARILAMQSSRR